jgi:hypothetical protein
VNGVETAVASGIQATSNITVQGGQNITITPTLNSQPVAFDKLYVAIDPNDVDTNDTVRINNISTIATLVTDDFVLPFSIRATEGDVDGDVTQEESFTWTVNGPGTNTTVVPEFDLLVV